MGKIIDLTGQCFGRLLVLECVCIKDHGACWRCFCDPEFGGCSNTVIIGGVSLRNGNTKSCGCLNRERTAEANRIDLVGRRFGRLLVLKFAYSKNSEAYWKCLCDCGNEKIIHSASLKKGNTKSCGCLSKEKASARCGENHSMFGIKGPEHPNYNPNLTNEEREIGRAYTKYYEWRIAVYERDDYTCQCCGQRGGKLAAHHLDGYDNFPELRILLKNGITLCEDCHRNFHQQYGKGNNTKKQFEKFFCAQKIAYNN